MPFQKGHKINTGRKNSLQQIENIRKGTKLAMARPDVKKKMSKNHADVSGKNNPMYGKYCEKSSRWKGNDIATVTKHGRIAQDKGKASEYKCVGDGINLCGKQAYDWSNVDHLYSLSVDDYQPKCRSCHRKYDFKLRKNKNK